MTRQTDVELRLRAEHAQRLRRAAITERVVVARGYRSVETKAELKRLGFADAQCRVPALLVHIFGVTGEVVNYQIRPDDPRIKNGKPLKYELPAGSQMALDVHPFIRERLGDPAIPLWITEGVFKADAAVSAGLCCIAVLGVWNWRGTNGLGGKTALPDWEAIALNGREVYIVFDSDVMTKPPVHDALTRLGNFLKSRGARVNFVYLPSGPGGQKTGLDDFLAADHTVDDLLHLASPTLRPTAPNDPDPHQPYLVTEAGTFWCQPCDNGFDEVLLANFSAVIVGDVVEDDGVEERRRYAIESTVRGRRCCVNVPAQQFAGLTWVGEHLGASAVIEPGYSIKDRLRHGIQVLSGDIPRRRVYIHTGWRQIDEIWAYLHGAGAIGPDGPILDVEVGLHGPLGRVALPEPPSGQARMQAIHAALQLLELLPPEIAYPLMGATWLAPLREFLGGDAPDFVVWLHGPSGTFKSEALALAQSFYGDFSRTSLPLNFSATANAIERFMFEAKDALLVIDDYHPASDPREQQAMNQVANRLLRGAGNQAGRARMRPDTTLRPALTPRCLAIASGERLPDGHSTIARMYAVAVAPGSVVPARLTMAQEQRHHYALALASYLQYLAQHVERLQEQLPRRFGALRAELQGLAGHRREPGQLAHLLLGLETFLSFALENTVTTVDTCQLHLQQARHVLLAQAREHAGTQAEEVPERLFQRYLSDGFAGKRAYLEDKRGGPPEAPELWGWEGMTQGEDTELATEKWRHSNTAQLVGVTDGAWLLLYPEQVYQFVVGAAKAAGRAFPVDQNTLWRRLDEADLIATELEGKERRRKVNVWFAGASKRVVKLRRDAIVPPSPVTDREDREDWEDPSDSHTYTQIPPSQSSGNGAVTGKALSDEACAVALPLPGLPGLPGAHMEEDEMHPESEEVIEWRA